MTANQLKNYLDRIQLTLDVKAAIAVGETKIIHRILEDMKQLKMKIHPKQR